MNLEEIKHELKGYFLYRINHSRQLALKTGNDFNVITGEIEYRTLTDNFKLTPIRYLIMQVNNQLLDPLAYVTDLSEVLPVIDFEVFINYDNRNNEIEKHKQLLETIKESKSIFGKKKDFKLIYIKSKREKSADYYVIKEKKVVPIDSNLIDTTENAVEVTNIRDVENALKDDFVNGYTEKYKEECMKWDSLN